MTTMRTTDMLQQSTIGAEVLWNIIKLSVYLNDLKAVSVVGVIGVVVGVIIGVVGVYHKYSRID